MQLQEKCVVDSNFLLQNVIYKATVKTEEDTKQYVESLGLTFKSKYTILTKYIWRLKDKNMDFNIKWEILARTKNKFNFKTALSVATLW